MDIYTDTPKDGFKQVYLGASFNKGRPVVEVFDDPDERDVWVEGAKIHTKTEVYTARIPEELDRIGGRHRDSLDYALDRLDVDLVFEVGE